MSSSALARASGAAAIRARHSSKPAAAVHEVVPQGVRRRVAMQLQLADAGGERHLGSQLGGERAYVVPARPASLSVQARPRPRAHRSARRAGRGSAAGRCGPGTGQSRWAIACGSPSRASTSNACSASTRDARPADVDVDPAPVVVPPVGGVGEDGSGGEVRALLPAHRLQRADQPEQVEGRTSTSTSLDWRPSARSPGSTAGPLRCSRSMSAVVGQLLDHGVGEVDARPDRHPPGGGARLLGHGPMVPASALRGVAVMCRLGCARRPRLAQHDVCGLRTAEPRLRVGADRLHDPRRPPDGRQDHPGARALLRDLVRAGPRRQRDRPRARSRATRSSPRTRPTSTPSSSPRPRWPSRSSTSSASTCRRAPSPAASRRSVDADVNALTVTADRDHAARRRATSPTPSWRPWSSSPGDRDGQSTSNKTP